MFGENKPASLSERLEEENSHEEPSTPEVQPSPLSLLSSLSDLAPKGDGSVNAMANTMKVTSQPINCNIMAAHLIPSSLRTLSGKF